MLTKERMSYKFLLRILGIIVALGVLIGIEKTPSVSLAKFDSYKLILDQKPNSSLQEFDLSATPSAVPTMTPLPTPTTTSGNTQFAFSLILLGIGNVPGNITPLHSQRVLKIEIYDGSHAKIFEKTGYVQFNPTTNAFEGTIDMGTLGSGLYTVKVKTDRYLTRAIAAQQIIFAQTNQISQASLIVGDINGDNLIDIQDYNIYVSCYKDRATSAQCGENKDLADLNDDGFNDSASDFSDYKLLFASLKVGKGD